MVCSVSPVTSHSGASGLQIGLHAAGTLTAPESDDLVWLSGAVTCQDPGMALAGGARHAAHIPDLGFVRVRYGGVTYPGGMLAPAPPDLLDRYAALLTDLGRRHGIVNLRHGGPGKVVADVEQGRTYFDLARFEMEARSILGHDVAVISADAPSAAGLAGPPLKASRAA